VVDVLFDMRGEGGEDCGFRIRSGGALVERREEDRRRVRRGRGRGREEMKVRRAGQEWREEGREGWRHGGFFCGLLFDLEFLLVCRGMLYVRLASIKFMLLLYPWGADWGRNSCWCCTCIFIQELRFGRTATCHRIPYQSIPEHTVPYNSTA